MRYVGRHRAPRPLYLRRPVVGGVAAALLIGGPALAISGPPQGLTGAKADDAPKTSAPASTASTVVPTDGVLPQDSPPETSTTTNAAGEKLTIVSTRNSVGQTVAVTTHPGGSKSTSIKSTKPTTTTIKPTKRPTKQPTRQPTKTSEEPEPTKTSEEPEPTKSTPAPEPTKTSAAPEPTKTGAAPAPAAGG